MGLDMYLYKDTYVQNWDHMSDAEKHTISITRDGKNVSHIKQERISFIREQIGSWRKANAIHAWFVKNVQDGKDDCGIYYVSDSDLEKLLSDTREVLASINLVGGVIQNGASASKETGYKLKPNFEVGKVVENSDVAEIVLPPVEGFFFGSTDYDEYYVKDLEDTERIIVQALIDGNQGDIYYSSSW